VIFDLDGTLVQTRVASWEIFRRIDERFALGVDRPEKYFELFNGNVFRSIRKLCRDDAHAQEVNAAFLELLRTEYTPPLVPGMAEVVRRLATDYTRGHVVQCDGSAPPGARRQRPRLLLRPCLRR